MSPAEPKSTPKASAKADTKADAKATAKPAAAASAAKPAASKDAGKAAAAPAAKAAAGAAPGASAAKLAAKPAARRRRRITRPGHKAAVRGGARIAAVTDEGRLAQVLVEPIISEKATHVAEKHNQVLFKVLLNATKPEIKAAVERMFKVEVASVQVLNHKGKEKRFGRSVGRRDHVKKAYVSLKAGHELNFSSEAA